MHSRRLEGGGKGLATDLLGKRAGCRRSHGKGGSAGCHWTGNAPCYVVGWQTEMDASDRDDSNLRDNEQQVGRIARVAYDVWRKRSLQTSRQGAGKAVAAKRVVVAQEGQATIFNND